MRVNRYDYWFPLALLGFVLLSLAVWRPVTDLGWFAYAPASEGRLIAQTTAVSFSSYHVVPSIDEGLRGLLTVVVAFLAGATWYAVRARRAVSVAWLGAMVLAVPAAAALAYLVVINAGRLFEGGELAVALSLPLLLLAACAAVGAYFARGVWRRIAVVGAVLLASVGVIAVVLPSADDSASVVVLVAGLFTLAWLHRSALVAVAGALFLLAGTTGSVADPARYVVPAAVLLAVAMSALVLRARPEGAQWTMER